MTSLLRALFHASTLRRFHAAPAGRPWLRPPASIAAAEILEGRVLLTAYVVETTVDTVAADGKVSLREAINASNTNAVVNEAAAGQGGGVTDTITFHAGLLNGTIALGGTELTISGDLQITGLGATSLTVSGSNLTRVFSVANGVTVEIRSLKVSGGKATNSDAGGISNFGTLTLADVAVSGNTAGFTGGGVFNSGTLTVTDSTVTGNTAVGSGGGVSNTGTANIIRSTITGNSGVSGGGLRSDAGTLKVGDSTITDNRATASGGGVFGINTVVTISGGTISSNSAGDGGGVFVQVGGTLAITNSTFSGNTASGDGGGIVVQNIPATLRNVTVFGNRADSDGNRIGAGGGIRIQGGPFTVHNTLCAGNVHGLNAGAADDVSGTFAAASSNNLIGTATSAGGLANGTNGNVVGIAAAAVLDPLLRDNGGPTMTHALLVGSAAIDAGANAQAVDFLGGALVRDQRGAARLVGARVDIGAYERLAAAVVDTLADEEDGDGTAGNLSLREAADFVAAGGTVSFASALSGGTISLSLGKIDLARDLSLAGLGASLLTVRGNDLSRVFAVATGVTADLRGLKITGGGIVNSGILAVTDAVISDNHFATLGGGISNLGSLTLKRVTVSGNSATNAGGGIANNVGRTLSVADSTVSGNTARAPGGGIFDFGSGTVTVVNSTISGNSTTSSGGGIEGKATLRNVTVFGNRADSDGDGIGTGGGVSGTMTLHNTLVAGNLRGSGAGTADEFRGAVGVGSSNNLIGDLATAGTFANGVNGNIVGVNPATVLDAVLRDNGGPTKTHALVAGSAAIDAASNAQALDAAGNPLAKDQRGAARLVGPKVDIGAYERVVSVVADLLQDENDGNVAPGDLSLREAVNVVGVGGGVTFAAGLAGKTIALSLGQIDLARDVRIVGLGASRLAVSGGGVSRVFAVEAGVSAEIRELTVTGGKAPDVAGGGIVNGGILALSGVVITGNLAPQGGGVFSSGTLTANGVTITANAASEGGGIYNAGALVVGNSTVSGNSGSTSGGGIFNAGSLLANGISVSGNTAGEGGGIHSFSTLNIGDSTVSGNTAVRNGGGMLSAGTVQLAGVTISGNSAGGEGGGIDDFGQTTLRNVTVFGNRSDSDGNGQGQGGGIFEELGQLTLHNSLLAGNIRGAGAGTPDDLVVGFGAGAFNAASSHNLFGAAPSGAGTPTDGTNGNIVGVSVAGLLDPILRDNGGPTKTHRLLFGSRAVDAGDNAQALGVLGVASAFDQRGEGFRRILQARVDIGALEAAPAADLVGYVNGQWWVGASDATKLTTTLWAGVPNSAYDALGEADFTGDGKADAFALLDGAWSVGTSTGTAFTFAPWGGWANADWQDVKAGDLNGDGKADILARLGGQWWGALSTGTSFTSPTLWTAWAALPWREFFLNDVSGDGKADLVGYQRGQWWAALSTGISFAGPKLFTTWSDAAWQKLLVLDADGDGQCDVAGFINGAWWVGISSGSDPSPAFTTTLWAQWASNLSYVDLLAGDFDGNGRDDVLGRSGGNWWVGLSNAPISATFAAPKLFATWSNLAWKDVRVADFDGDGRDGIAGRINGQWWIAESVGSSAATTLWATWAELAWRAVGVVDATGHVVSSAGSGGAFSSSQSASQSSALAFPIADDEPLRLFWTKSEKDEEFAARVLMAG